RAPVGRCEGCSQGPRQGGPCCYPVVMTNEPDPYRHPCRLERSAKTGCRHETPSSSCPRRDSLIDPALPEITTASPLLHHSPGHLRWQVLSRVTASGTAQLQTTGFLRQ